ncbi:MAG: hypothetical protein K0Q55_2525, partial [Verrucomicrobia bacterium]|nr:hypothetical protein [Verrucomicrobiota bacterium]
STEREVDLSQMKPEGLAKLAAHVRSWTEAPRTPSLEEVPGEHLESLSIERRVSQRRGSWLQVGPEVAPPADE